MTSPVAQKLTPNFASRGTSRSLHVPVTVCCASRQSTTCTRSVTRRTLAETEVCHRPCFRHHYAFLYARVCVCVWTHVSIYMCTVCMRVCTCALASRYILCPCGCACFSSAGQLYIIIKKRTLWWRGCAHVASKHIAVLAKTHSFLKREMSTHICIILFLHITLPPTFVNSRIICQIEITDLQIIWECWKAENTIYFLKTLFDTVSRITSQFNVYL